MWESCSSAKAPFRNLIQELTDVVSGKEELLMRDMSEPNSLLPLLAYQDSGSDVEMIN